MIKILLKIEGFEQRESPPDKIAEQLVPDVAGVWDVSMVDPSYFPEMFSDEGLYGSHIGDRENYMRAGACGS